MNNFYPFSDLKSFESDFFQKFQSPSRKEFSQALNRMTKISLKFQTRKKCQIMEMQSLKYFESIQHLTCYDVVIGTIDMELIFQNHLHHK